MDCPIFFIKSRKTHSLHGLVGSSPVMQQIYQKIGCLAKTDTTVLIVGETGTGKELAAEAIHQMSSRRSAPIVQINCAAFSEHLLESELFGHVKGAFTGAIKDRLGRFEAAQGGTLFLDEIGDISPAIQVSLLRVLEQKCIERIGCNVTHSLDVRIITATNKDLAIEIASGRFRADLFHRLNTVTLTLPSLRERRDDIPELAEHFIQCFNQNFSNKIRGISPDAMEELTNRPWAGNVRELKNAIEHAFVYCRGDIIHIKDLGQCIEHFAPPDCGERRKGDRRTSASFPDPTHPIQAILTDADALRKILEQHCWHIGRTAAALGMHRTTLWRHMQGFGLSKNN